MTSWERTWFDKLDTTWPASPYCLNLINHSVREMYVKSSQRAVNLTRLTDVFGSKCALHGAGGIGRCATKRAT
eukprot:4580320-Amphidinium_carterae.1